MKSQSIHQVNASHVRLGAVATEAAIVLPILLTMAFAAADFSRVMGMASELSNAVRSGAESGATHRPTSLTYNSWEARVRTAILEELGDSNRFDVGKVSISIALSTDSHGWQIVRITGQYPFQTAVSWPFLPNQVPLRSQVAMRQYR